MNANLTRHGLAIDKATNDLFLDATNNLAMVSNAEAVGQHARQRLMTFHGEWFLDTEAGVTWLDDILGKREDFPLAEAIVKAEIIATDGVVGIGTFSISLARPERNLIIRDVQVTTEYDVEVSV
jgi:hypothetical protein